MVLYDSAAGFTLEEGVLMNNVWDHSHSNFNTFVPYSGTVSLEDSVS